MISRCKGLRKWITHNTQACKTHQANKANKALTITFGSPNYNLKGEEINNKKIPNYYIFYLNTCFETPNY